jgi:hypothetical protein
MAVVGGQQGLGPRRQLADQLDHRVLACPAAGLEFVLYPLATVTRPTSDAGYLLNFNAGPALPPLTSLDPSDGPAFWYPIDRAITRQSGASLYGPPATQLFAELPFDGLLRFRAAGRGDIGSGGRTGFSARSVAAITESAVQVEVSKRLQHEGLGQACGGEVTEMK